MSMPVRPLLTFAIVTAHYLTSRRLHLSISARTRTTVRLPRTSTTPTTSPASPLSLPRRVSASPCATVKAPAILPAIRFLLLGAPALRKEARYHRHRRRLAECLAITRAIVIFADYLADLIVFDLLADIAASPVPSAAIAATCAGLSIGIVLADGITGVAAWLSSRYFPYGAFCCLPDTVDSYPKERNHSHHRTYEVISRYHQSPCSGHMGTKATIVTEPVVTNFETKDLISEPDVFHQLVNSCFLCTPPLTLATSWSATAVTSHCSIFFQAASVATLALAALAPILRPAPARPDAPLVAFLRRCRFLKMTQSNGWGQICGVADPLLSVVLPHIDMAVATARKHNVKHDTPSPP